jgi:PIN domain nuclease of toxin-antitoxin system
MTERMVLDSWAILAWLQGESVGAVVRDLLDWAGGGEAAGKRVRSRWGDEVSRPNLFVSLINLGEVFYILGRKKGEREARETVEEIKGGVVRVVPVSEELIFKAALFKLGPLNCKNLG